jgi:hypothetical protein
VYQQEQRFFGIETEKGLVELCRDDSIVGEELKAEFLVSSTLIFINNIFRSFINQPSVIWTNGSSLIVTILLQN